MLTIAALTAEVARLAGRVRAIERRVALLAVVEAARVKRSVQNIGPLATGTTVVPVTWPVPFADDLYVVLPELVTGVNGIGAVHAALTVGSRTPEGCTITVVSTASVAVAVLDVLGVRP